MSPTKLRRGVCGNTDLCKVCCDNYNYFYICALNWIILSYTTSLIYWMFIEVLISLYPLHVFDITLTTFKEFRIFWPCFFVGTSVKGTNNFCKVSGMIYGFNKSRRKIASVVGKTADDSMSAMQFCTTPKLDLPHYYYISFVITVPLITPCNIPYIFSVFCFF